MSPLEIKTNKFVIKQVIDKESSWTGSYLLHLDDPNRFQSRLTR